MRKPLIVLGITALLVSCTKEIDVDLPTTDPKLVVEGTIEPGQPPIVILTRTQSYFASTDLSSIAGSYVSGATITVTDGGNTVTLDELSSSGLTQEQIEQVALITGIDPTIIANANIVVYSKLDNTLLGEEGHIYRLNVSAENKSCSAITSIPHAVALDSVWWKLALQKPDDDSSGYAWARLTDPDTMGNGYRWMARRIYSTDPNFTKDSRFISPIGSSFPDKYINGLSFDFFAVRGRSPFTDNSDDETAGYFLRGDSVIVKFLSIGKAEEEFYNSYDNNVQSQGDLFATPANVRSNVNGGLGVWAGWAASYDTLVCQ